MGMSTHVVGFKPADEKWQRMKAVWDACEAAEVDIPADVERFFGWAAPDPAGVEVREATLKGCGAVLDWAYRSRSGFELDVSKLPPDVTIVRFYNSW